MNTFLSDILAQPEVLGNVLRSMLHVQRMEIETVARDLIAAPRIVLTSMGSAYYSLMPMAYALARLHSNVQLLEASELMRLPSFPGTVSIIMSRSGESKEIAELACLLHKRGERLIAITMTPRSTLAKNATISVHVPAPYDGFICTKAYSSMALTGLLIASMMEQQITPALEVSLQQAFAWLQANQNSFLQQLQKVPWLGESLAFLSRGAGMGLALSGALWLEEAARVHASQSSIDMFLHGPVEQVDQHFHGVWIDLQPDSLSAGQYQDMQAKGGNWLTIVLEHGYSGDFVLPAFDLPEAYRILLAAIPVQMVAYQSATMRGLEAGAMRYLDWVIK